MTKQERVAMGHRLRQQRTLLGLTREEFAELADISAGYYGQIEVGTSQMSIDTLIKIIEDVAALNGVYPFGRGDSARCRSDRHRGPAGPVHAPGGPAG